MFYVNIWPNLFKKLQIPGTDCIYACFRLQSGCKNLADFAVPDDANLVMHSWYPFNKRVFVPLLNQHRAGLRGAQLTAWGCWRG